MDLTKLKLGMKQKHKDTMAELIGKESELVAITLHWKGEECSMKQTFSKEDNEEDI